MRQHGMGVLDTRRRSLESSECRPLKSGSGASGTKNCLVRLLMQLQVKGEALLLVDTLQRLRRRRPEVRAHPGTRSSLRLEPFAERAREK